MTVEYTRSQLHDPPDLGHVVSEFNRSARGNGTAAGEANVQRGVSNKDAVILIVSRPQTSLRLKVQQYQQESGSCSRTLQSVGESVAMTLTPTSGSSAMSRNFP